MKYSHTGAIFALAVVGFLFSGYLSGVKFFTSTCALGETCPFFLGYPACYFGFGLFALVLAGAAALYAHSLARAGRMTVLVVALLGSVFAGYYTLGELPILFSQGIGAYLLGLPTCAFGFLVFVTVFLLALTSARTRMFEEIEQI